MNSTLASTIFMPFNDKRIWSGFFIARKKFNQLNTQAAKLNTWTIFFVTRGVNKWQSLANTTKEQNTLLQGQHYKHPYHLVNVSPWPFLITLSLLAFMVGFVMYFHQFTSGASIMLLGLITLVFVMICWFRDIVREGTFEGHHTQLVQRGLKVGMILFIISEVCFFFSFFWAFFHSSLSPAIQIGGIWPPKGITVFNPWEIPLLNTLILLTSGVSVTWAHYAIRSEFVSFVATKFSVIKYFAHYLQQPFATKPFFRSYVLGLHNIKSTIKREYLVDTLNTLNFIIPFSTSLKNYQTFRAFLEPTNELKSINQFQYFYGIYFKRSRHSLLLALGVTVFLGILFTLIQFFEYKHAAFTIADSIYGSTFYLTTGFHGLHVLVGTIFLIVCFFRMYSYHFTTTHHVGLESAIWYWHFVDVVWLGLYISIYHWGGSF